MTDLPATVLYEINHYDELYRPKNSKGEIIHPDFVKLPIKPNGKGLKKLQIEAKWLQIFGMWCLLLELATENKIILRGKILNHKDKPASLAEIAAMLSLSRKRSFVKYALDILCDMGWLISSPILEKVEKKLEKAEKKSDANETKPETKPKVREKNNETNIRSCSRGLSDSVFVDKTENGATKQKCLLVFIDLLRQIFTVEQRLTLTPSDTTTFTGLFNQHWEAVGESGIVDRMNKLGEIARGSRDAKNPRAYFVSTQERLFSKP